MSELAETISVAWKRMRNGRAPLPEAGIVAPQHCYPPDAAGRPIRANEMYFSIRVSEMHLAFNSEWWAVYEPLVLVVTEFNHGSERVALPSIIGPNLIKKQNPNDQAHYGTVLMDTLVTGPHPYRGGDIDVSVAFYKIQRTNLAHTLMRVVGTLSSSLGDPGALGILSKTGGALLQGVEGLLDMQETTYLAGLRAPLAPSPLDPFTTGFLALVVPPAPDVRRLHVKDRRLYAESGGTVEKYHASDFVLLNVIGMSSRDDESLLPFYTLKQDALTALWDGEDGLKRAKAILITAYQQMQRSPDVSVAEARRMFEAWLQEFEVEKQRLERVRAMPRGAEQRQASDLAMELAAAARRLGL